MIPVSRVGLIFTLLFLAAACGKKEKVLVIPEGFERDSIIPETKLVCLLCDVHIAEAGMVLERTERADSKARAEVIYNGIFSKYHITRSRYAANLKYYSMNPEHFAKIYDKVILRIQEKQKWVSRKK